MSNSPLDKKPHIDGQKSNNVQFKTKDIGRWASMQENPFAEQNRKAAERRQEVTKKRLKVAPAVIATISVIVIAFGIWGLVSLVIHVVNNWPKEEVVAEVIEGNSQEDISKYRDILQNFYNQHNNLESVQDVVNTTLDSESGQQYPEAVKIAESNFYVFNGFYQEAIDAALSIDESKLTDEQKVQYYNTFSYGYTMLEDTEKAQEYKQKLYDLTADMEGYYGGN